MAIPIVEVGLQIGSQLIERLWPNPAEAAAAKLKLYELEKTGELQQILAQAEINKVEAASQSIWVAGWRPFVGWVCGLAFFYKFVFAPLVVLILAGFGVIITLPVLDFTEMSTILLGMLGIGGLRTIEKIKNVSAQ